MIDKKFLLALAIIVVLVLALLYVVVIGPKIQGYIVNKQLQAQQNIVNTILQVVDEQGYIAINNDETSIVLVKYQPQDQDIQIDKLDNSAQGDEITELAV